MIIRRRCKDVCGSSSWRLDAEDFQHSRCGGCFLHLESTKEIGNQLCVFQIQSGGSADCGGGGMKSAGSHPQKNTPS